MMQNPNPASKPPELPMYQQEMVGKRRQRKKMWGPVQPRFEDDTLFVVNHGGPSVQDRIYTDSTPQRVLKDPFGPRHTRRRKDGSRKEAEEDDEGGDDSM